MKNPTHARQAQDDDRGQEELSEDDLDTRPEITPNSSGGAAYHGPRGQGDDSRLLTVVFTDARFLHVGTGA